MPIDIEEFRSNHPTLKNIVLLDLGGEDGTDPLEKADAVLPNGERIHLQTTDDLRALLNSDAVDHEQGPMQRLAAALAPERAGSMLNGNERYEALMMLQRRCWEAVAKEIAERVEEKEVIPKQSRIATVMSEAWKRAASILW